MTSAAGGGEQPAGPSNYGPSISASSAAGARRPMKNGAERGETDSRPVGVGGDRRGSSAGLRGRRQLGKHPAWLPTNRRTNSAECGLIERREFGGDARAAGTEGVSGESSRPESVPAASLRPSASRRAIQRSGSRGQPDRTFLLVF